MSKAEAGKGSKPRQGSDHQKYADNWDRIFGKSQAQRALEQMVDENQRLGLCDEKPVDSDAK